MPSRLAILLFDQFLHLFLLNNFFVLLVEELLFEDRVSYIKLIIFTFFFFIICLVKAVFKTHLIVSLILFYESVRLVFILTLQIVIENLLSFARLFKHLLQRVVVWCLLWLRLWDVIHYSHRPLAFPFLHEVVLVHLDEVFGYRSFLLWVPLCHCPAFHTRRVLGAKHNFIFHSFGSVLLKVFLLHLLHHQ